MDKKSVPDPVFVEGGPGTLSILAEPLFVNHAVFKLGELRAVPASCSTYEIPCDSLKLVNLAALAVRALLQICISVLISAVHAAVAVVVD